MFFIKAVTSLKKGSPLSIFIGNRPEKYNFDLKIHNYVISTNKKGVKAKNRTFLQFFFQNRKVIIRKKLKLLSSGFAMCFSISFLFCESRTVTTPATALRLAHNCFISCKAASLVFAFPIPRVAVRPIICFIFKKLNKILHKYLLS